MTASPLAAQHTQLSAPPRKDLAAGRPGVERDDSGQRGDLVIGARVVEKVAVQAVHQVGAAGGAARRVLGVTVGELTETSDARVSAEVDGDVAVVTVTMGVHWPASITAVADQVRRRIREEVVAVTGIAVRRIDLEVVSLDVPRHDRARVR